MKRNLFTRILCALLALSSVFAVACGGDTAGSADTTAVEGTTTEAVTTADPLADNLPEKDYNGYEFRILTETDYLAFAVMEESTGDVVDDAIFERNSVIEERFGVKFTAIHDTYDKLKPKILASIQSGDDDYDLLCYHVVQSGVYAVEGLFMNWYDLEYVDFSRPWWAKSTTEDLSVNGYCPLAVGDFAITALANTYCVFFNYRIADEFGIGNIYETVNEGKWTLDKAAELSKNVYRDLNANNTVDDKDLFGYASTCRSSLNAYLWSFGGKVISNGDSGKLELVYHTDRTADMVSKLCEFFFERDGVTINKPDANYTFMWSIDMFNEGRALFINGNINNGIKYFRDLDDDFGIIPYPKWDEAQDDYYTMVDGSHDILAVPVTVTDPERTGIITEALCAETYKRVVPAYYDVALKTKGTRDEESIAMIDFVVSKRIFDIGYVYDAWKGASFIFQTLIAANNPNLESHWASKSAAIEEHYSAVTEFFNGK